MWRVKDIVHMNQPCFVFGYESEPYDIRFVQNDHLNMMLSLHKGPNQIILASLIDFKIVSKIKLPHEARKMEIHPNFCEIFVTSVFNDKESKEVDLISQSIGFKMSDPIIGYLNLRDHNLCTFLKSITDSRTEN